MSVGGKEKIRVVQGKAQRFIGLFRASYFGRNLIVQSKYLGSLRYWLYSVPMNRATRLTVQSDADTLLWSKTPDLGAPKQSFRRWVEQRTAIGPRGRGGSKRQGYTALDCPSRLPTTTGGQSGAKSAMVT